MSGELPRTRHIKGAELERDPLSTLHEIVPGVLADAELAQFEKTFGVGEEQVRRDHVISHTLAALSTLNTDDLVFFGGTALSRTHLVDLRLSEDIDLIALASRRDVAEQIQSEVARGLQRSLGAATFAPDLRATKHPEPSVMTVGDVNIQVQLVSGQNYPKWPTAVIDIEQRYSDAPPARLRVPTAAGFVAAKLTAWDNRAAPRDLYDLWALAERGMVNDEARDVFARWGTYTKVSSVAFDPIPTEAQWEAALGHQCIPQVGPDDAAAAVRRALDRL